MKARYNAAFFWEGENISQSRDPLQSGELVYCSLVTFLRSVGGRQLGFKPEFEKGMDQEVYQLEDSHIFIYHLPDHQGKYQIRVAIFSRENKSDVGGMEKKVKKHFEERSLRINEVL